MNLLELKQKIDFAVENERNPETINVCIPNNKKGTFGPTPTTGIKGAYLGIDWNKSKFMLYPEVDMIEETKQH